MGTKPVEASKSENIFPCFWLVALKPMRYPLSICHIAANACDKKKLRPHHSDFNTVKTTYDVANNGSRKIARKSGQKSPSPYRNT